METPDPNSKIAPVQAAAENLFNYAIERDDLKPMVALLPDDEKINKVTVEYELQLLKIISIGWGISFFMAEHPVKEKLAEAFWNSIQRLSHDISSATSASVGKDVDYFGIIKQRLDIYVNALQHYTDAPDLAKVIGITFAKLCGDEANTYITLAGKRTFSLASANVKNYIEALPISDT
jgi:hypothetical protein